tara:strand:+ start:444 stop:596 length:153 start_codon:yes stop_codon:yes gene_type:complete
MRRRKEESAFFNLLAVTLKKRELFNIIILEGHMRRMLRSLIMRREVKWYL